LPDVAPGACSVPPDTHIDGWATREVEAGFHEQPPAMSNTATGTRKIAPGVCGTASGTGKVLPAVRKDTSGRHSDMAPK